MTCLLCGDQCGVAVRRLQGEDLGDLPVEGGHLYCRAGEERGNRFAQVRELLLRRRRVTCLAWPRTYLHRRGAHYLFRSSRASSVV